MGRTRLAAIAATTLVAAAAPAAAEARGVGLWSVYDSALSHARYIDLTHTITPNMPVWKGFGPATFEPAVDPSTGNPSPSAKSGFEATAYRIATDSSAPSSTRPPTGRPSTPASTSCRPPS